MLAGVAREAGRRFGDRVVVDADGELLTYRELDRRADELAGGLVDRGVGSGDVVALVLHSGIEWLVAAVALSRLGAVAAGVSPVLTGAERAAMVRLVGPRLALAHPDLLEELPLRTDTAVLARGARGADLARRGASIADPPPDPERPATICFTSGTTGEPKAALFRERQLAAISRIDLGPEGARQWGGGSPMLASTQFAHVGMATKLPWYLRVGATLHVMERWRADDALRLVAAHRMPTLGVVAPQLALMLRSPLLDELDLGCVRSIVAGGAASPPALVEQARRRFGAAYSIRYSSTESGGVGLATAFDAPDEEALHTIGRPRPGVEVRIADAEDRQVPDGEVGELQLRSAAVMDRYWANPTATTAALTGDGWLRTGDLASRRPDGCVVLAGRRSELYIRGGYNVFPGEVEAVLAEHPRVADVVVVPRPDPVMGEVGVALVVPEGAAPTLAELRDHAAGRLARHKLPERLHLVDAVPLTPAQKVDRRAAAARCAELEASGGVQDRDAAADGIG